MLSARWGVWLVVKDAEMSYCTVYYDVYDFVGSCMGKVQLSTYVRHIARVSMELACYNVIMIIHFSMSYIHTVQYIGFYMCEYSPTQYVCTVCTVQTGEVGSIRKNP